MYTRILAPIDGSETSSHAFDTAVQLARENGAELQPLYVLDVPMSVYAASGLDPTGIRDAMLQQGTEVTAAALAKMKGEHVSGSTRIVEVAALDDDIARAILRAATDMKADLVVMGTHGRRGFQRLMLGSVAERVLRMATGPVLLVPSHHAKQAATAQQTNT